MTESYYAAYRRNRWSLLAALLVLASLVTPSTAWGYKPTDPEVRKLVTDALKHLATLEDGRLGGKCLIGLAFLKGNDEKNHPKVREAVAACKEAVKGGTFNNTEEGPVYSLGVALIFLCELDPDEYRSEIDVLLREMIKLQKKHGGWGYPHGTYVNASDTSMTQYGALSFWTAKRMAGVNVPQDDIERMAAWLARTQDVSGGWGYQGRDPGSFNRVQQQGVSRSLTAAGLGSVYIAADLLGVTIPKQQARDGDLPPGLQEVVEEPAAKPDAPRTRLDPGVLRTAMGGGNNWFNAHGGISNETWVYYYMYALERYMSFREYAEGKRGDDAPWYNAGVEFLKKQKNNKGSWDAGCGPAVDTSFAILFLVRSTFKSIAKADRTYNEGVLTGGRGLGKDVSQAQINSRGKVISEPVTVSKVDDLLELLTKADSQKDVDAASTLVLPDRIDLNEHNKTEREKQLEQLRALVSVPNYEARLVAVKTLGRARSLDNVPVLIFALTDPDNRVMREARDGLCFISRKFNGGYGPADEATEAQKRAAADAWWQWYLSIRPEAAATEGPTAP